MKVYKHRTHKSLAKSNGSKDWEQNREKTLRKGGKKETKVKRQQAHTHTHSLSQKGYNFYN